MKHFYFILMSHCSLPMNYRHRVWGPTVCLHCAHNSVVQTSIGTYCVVLLLLVRGLRGDRAISFFMSCIPSTYTCIGADIEFLFRSLLNLHPHSFLSAHVEIPRKCPFHGQPLKNNLIYMYEWFVYICVCASLVSACRGQKRASDSSGTGGTGSCKLPCRCW